MGKDKLRKFAENATFRCMVQPSTQEVLGRDHPLKGRWGADFFHNDHPIVLELGCGKGDYTVALARRHPDVNYIGVDIKGARMWKGAKAVETEGLQNVAFLRTRIEFITSLFAAGEVSCIWITFADPQIGHERRRLTAPAFLQRYSTFLAPGGEVRLKTDSRYLYEYTLALCRQSGLDILSATEDLYAQSRRAAAAQASLELASQAASGFPEELFSVQTFYERHFLAQGYPITYLCFRPGSGPFRSPDWDEAAWRGEDHHAFVVQVL